MRLYSFNSGKFTSTIWTYRLILVTLKGSDVHVKVVWIYRTHATHDLAPSNDCGRYVAPGSFLNTISMQTDIPIANRLIVDTLFQMIYKIYKILSETGTDG